MSLLQSRVDVSGSAVFQNNSARVGGALDLEDQSIVGTHAWSSIKPTELKLFFYL